MRRMAMGLSAVLALAGTASADDAASLTATAQPTAQNAVYAELGGNGAWYSVNYERFLRPDAAVRAGFMYMSMTATASSGGQASSASATWAVVPLMFEYLGVHSGSHALELGAGIDMMYFGGQGMTVDAAAGASGMTPVGTATIGYRYSNPAGGFIFRAGYTPLIFVTTDQKTIMHWGGMSFGYRF